MLTGLKEGSVVIGVGIFFYDETTNIDFDVDKVVEIGKPAMVSQKN